MTDTEHIRFKPSPGHLLLQPVETKSRFQPEKSKSEGLTSEARLGKVLAIGDDDINEFGTKIVQPCKLGDVVLYTHKYDQDELEIDFLLYAVIRFEQVRGTYNG